MKVTVTGGVGFIGRRLVSELEERGHEVAILDRRADGSVPVLPGVRAVCGDVRDPSAVEEALAEGTDVVVHLAAVTSVLRSKEDPVETFEVNTHATSLLLEQARRVGSSIFVLASTNAVAGDVGDSRISEETVPAPLTPYGATKAAAEMLMSAYADSYGMRCCAVRLTNVYGPGMKEKDSFVPRLMRASLTGGSVVVYGDGGQVRDFVYVDDAVAGLVLPLDRPVIGTLTIGCGQSVSVNELVELVRSATGVEIEVRHGDPKPGEMRAVRVDTSRAASFGFRTSVDLPEGLARTWKDMRATA